MKNLKKLTNKNLKMINGGEERCPAIAYDCSAWCGWSLWQKMYCLHTTEGCNCDSF